MLERALTWAYLSENRRLIRHRGRGAHHDKAPPALRPFCARHEKRPLTRLLVQWQNATCSNPSTRRRSSAPEQNRLQKDVPGAAGVTSDAAGA